MKTLFQRINRRLLIDPENAIHEPRSVFILAIAGAFAYLRYQYSQYFERVGTQTKSDGN